MRRMRVAIVADFLEEGWPSMDLVADMLFDRLQREHVESVEATLIRPRLKKRVSLMPWAGKHRLVFGVDRVANRLWDYPRALAGMASRFDIFHIVDHSYSQLVHPLPAGRTLVTCHDLDTFRSVLDPAAESRAAPFRAMTRHILEGMRKAGHVACDSAATRDALVQRAGIDVARTTVVHNGPHPTCSPSPEGAADFEAGRLLGPRDQWADVLHVGSTIARKRIDVLLRVFAAVRRQRPGTRLVRAGGPLTAEQRALARDLGIADHIVHLPVLDRATLAAVYRRSALLLLPSDREGFGLPVLEALACGTPVVASDIAALREVGGYAASYCPPDDVSSWCATVVRLLDERTRDAGQWKLRRESGLRRAQAFSWSQYAHEIARLYASLSAASFQLPASS